MNRSSNVQTIVVFTLITVAVCTLNVVIEFGTRHYYTFDKQNYVKNLNDKNWRQVLKNEWMIEFYAPWCQSCKNLDPIWERFALNAIKYNINVAKIDITTSPSLRGRFFISALPTIMHVKDGNFRHYHNEPDEYALMRWIKEKHWLAVKPNSKWKDPDTILMSISSQFFKFSSMIKDINACLQAKYGLPNWCSYAIFGISTALIGAALGQVLGSIVDSLYPTKISSPKLLAAVKEDENLLSEKSDLEIISIDELSSCDNFDYEMEDTDDFLSEHSDFFGCNRRKKNDENSDLESYESEVELADEYGFPKKVIYI